MNETGSVKFTFEQVAVRPVEFPGFQELNACRRKLLQLGLLGIDSMGIGFGNLSVRDRAANAFYITGSGTGGIADFTPEHCAKVSAYDFARDWLRSEGAAVPSSESLTHAAVYEANSSAAAIIHCHSAAIWKRLRDVLPTTSAGVDYGTSAMAQEVMRLFSSTDVKETRVFIMAGHEEGVVAFGADFNEAFEALMAHANSPVPFRDT